MSSTQQIKWPTWQEVAAGGPSELGRLIAWESNPLKHTQRNSPRRLIRVDVLPQTKGVGGQLCHRGINFLIVYEDQIPGILKMVPTEKDKALLEAATETYNRGLEQHARALGLRDGMDPAVAAGFMKRARESYTRTPYNIITQMVNATSDENASCRAYPGYPPLISVDVHPDPVPPPLTPQSYAEEQGDKQARAMGRALSEALPQVLASMGITPKAARGG